MIDSSQLISERTSSTLLSLSIVCCCCCCDCAHLIIELTKLACVCVWSMVVKLERDIKSMFFSRSFFFSLSLCLCNSMKSLLLASTASSLLQAALMSRSNQIREEEEEGKTKKMASFFSRSNFLFFLSSVALFIFFSFSFLGRNFIF